MASSDTTGIETGKVGAPLCYNHAMRILVTGGRGFVGSNLVSALGQAGHDVLAPSHQELDLRDRAAVDAFLSGQAVECVVHAAGRVGGIAANIAAPTEFFVENMEIGMTLLQAAEVHGVKRLLNLSSSCVYPRDLPKLREEDLFTGPLEPTNEAYALAKISTGRLAEWIQARQPDFAWRTILPCNLYGPGDVFHGERSHLVSSILGKIDEALRTGADEIVIWGDGTVRREFMYIDDLTAAVLFLLPRLEELPPYLNVGTGKDYSVQEYYETAARVIGWEGDFSHDLTKPVGMKRKLLDVSRLNELGFTAGIDLEAGLRSTYDWFKAQEEVPA